MNKFVKGISVDAGIIMLCDINYYKKYEEEPFFDDKLAKIINIKPGIYNCEWSIKETWNGSIDGVGLIKIDSGKLIVSDPCYCIDKGWEKWLEDTDYGRNTPTDTIIINEMGGDGRYNIELVIVPVEEI